MDQNSIEIKSLLDAGNKDEAIRLLSLLIRKKPNQVDTWFLLADAVEDHKKKLDCYRRILRIDPSNTIAKQKVSDYSRIVEHTANLPSKSISGEVQKSPKPENRKQKE